MRKQRRLSIESLESRDNPAPVIPGFSDDGGSSQTEGVSDQQQHNGDAAGTAGNDVGDGDLTPIEVGSDLHQQGGDSAAGNGVGDDVSMQNEAGSDSHQQDGEFAATAGD